MSEYVVFTEESLHSFYDPATCSYMVPLSGKAAHDMKMLRDERDWLQAENAKLRELCVDMFTCISHANEADWFYFERDKHGCGMSCVVNGEGCGLSVLADRMRELGVEE